MKWKWTSDLKYNKRNAFVVLYDANCVLILACDASEDSINVPDGTEQPTAFASRTLNSAEKKIFTS